jgi:hypothetical protein
MNPNGPDERRPSSLQAVKYLFATPSVSYSGEATLLAQWLTEGVSKTFCSSGLVAGPELRPPHGAIRAVLRVIRIKQSVAPARGSLACAVRKRSHRLMARIGVHAVPERTR